MSDLTPMARKALEQVKPYSPGKPMEELKRELGLTSVIKLASNENALGPSPKAVEAMRQAADQVHRYPDGACYDLVKALSSKLGVSSEQLIVGNGSDEVITFAARAFLNPEDEVIVAYPTFLIYEITTQVVGAKTKVVPLRNYRYDLDAMAAAVSEQTKLIYIANPDNPTGSYVTRPELEAFLEKLPEHVIVFLDEAYAELVDVPDYPDGLSYIKNHKLIVSRTFSKAYGLGGMRVGYGVASEALIAAMHRVREPFNVNLLAQAGATAALGDEAHLDATRALLREQKPILIKALQDAGFEVLPSVTNFVMFQAGDKAEAINEALLKQGIIIRHLKAWGLPEFMRVTVGTPEENQQFVAALKESLS